MLCAPLLQARRLRPRLRGDRLRIRQFGDHNVSKEIGMAEGQFLRLHTVQVGPMRRGARRHAELHGDGSADVSVLFVYAKGLSSVNLNLSTTNSICILAD